MQPRIVYEKAGIYIEYNAEGMVIKKNGLTIEVPAWILEDFEREFELAKLDYIKQLTNRSEP